MKENFFVTFLVIWGPFFPHILGRKWTILTTGHKQWLLHLPVHCRFVQLWRREADAVCSLLNEEGWQPGCSSTRLGWPWLQQPKMEEASPEAPRGQRPSEASVPRGCLYLCLQFLLLPKGQTSVLCRHNKFPCWRESARWIVDGNLCFMEIRWENTHTYEMPWELSIWIPKKNTVVLSSTRQICCSSRGYRVLQTEWDLMSKETWSASCSGLSVQAGQGGCGVSTDVR